MVREDGLLRFWTGALSLVLQQFTATLPADLIRQITGLRAQWKANIVLGPERAVDLRISHKHRGFTNH